MMPQKDETHVVQSVDSCFSGAFKCVFTAVPMSMQNKMLSCVTFDPLSLTVARLKTLTSSLVCLMIHSSEGCVYLIYMMILQAII